MSARFDAYKQAQHHKEREAKTTKLLPYQEEALKKIAKGEHLFVIAPRTAGKSYLINKSVENPKKDEV